MPMEVDFCLIFGVFKDKHVVDVYGNNRASYSCIIDVPRETPFYPFLVLRTGNRSQSKLDFIQVITFNVVIFKYAINRVIKVKCAF